MTRKLRCQCAPAARLSLRLALRLRSLTSASQPFVRHRTRQERDTSIAVATHSRSHPHSAQSLTRSPASFCPSPRVRMPDHERDFSPDRPRHPFPSVPRFGFGPFVLRSSQQVLALSLSPKDNNNNNGGSKIRPRFSILLLPVSLRPPLIRLLRMCN